MTQPIPIIHLDDDAHPSITIDATQHNPAVRLVKGTYQRWRRSISTPLVLLFLLAPWLPMGDAPMVQMNLASRQLHLFGFTFWPEDLLILLWLAMASAFGLFAVATFAGRLWCGFTCPQTVCSMMFIWVEEKLEGSRHQRLKAITDHKTISLRKIIKHTVWLVISMITGFTFVAFFETGTHLFQQLLSLNASGEVWFWLCFFSALTYINGGWLREQVCLHMCPYSRFQSVMLDQKSLKVSYDVSRGEPRTKKSQVNNPKPHQGDCINCTLCVQVCPVGIDIRQGLQYACIDCGACIDACDNVMQQIDKPTGLIKFSNHITHDWKALLRDRLRLWAYLALAVLSSMAFLLQAIYKESLSIHVARDRGSLYLVSATGEISNDFHIKLKNKSKQVQTITLTVDRKDLRLPESMSQPFSLQPGQTIDTTIRLLCLEPCRISGKQDIAFQFQGIDTTPLMRSITFFAP